MKIVYFSVTGQTRRFIKKLDLAACEIEPADPFFEINEPFVLVVPTYDQEITEVVNDFLDYKSNREYLQGVAGGGNLNFAELYVYTAKDIARYYNVPMLFAFEFSGTNEDVESFKKVVNELESKRN
ncbi:nrdI protein [Enterococcus sp. DIV0840]|uniref:class Ib ribonucleoside-diphosphate reductase assembly flavoprotein NrdI n=1 Tax=Enterococcus TaxID=1350 RepID=UPI001A90AF8A|nr:MULTISPECIES: class Ib ribonucleoside-diphosphate reductase assembly flavoprotein NrdI [Enterococcus]MBO0434096.1 class Ib ribonucleoside-diphosphate reductase assembly flavoprotein NrdI [Enterococcus sp. DIV0849a]MBO0473001.1 class Ib ribonucleoside-diphosphate reductase assembly flavoprotein NrdI [Enterococcus ureasiticus]